MAIHNLKFWVKRIILFICLIVIFFLSCTFYIIQEVLKNKDEDNLDPDITIFTICINHTIIKFLFLYEKNLCGIFFFIFLIVVIVYPHNTNMMKFFQLNFFILFDRINYSFYCSYNYFVYAAFCVFYVDFKITYINLFLNSLGLFILLIVINVLIVCIFELPLRMFIKSKMNKNIHKNFRMSFYSGGLFDQSYRSINSKHKNSL